MIIPLNPAISNVRQDLDYNQDEMAKFVIDAASALFSRNVALEQPGTYENFRNWLSNLLRSAEIELHSVFLGLAYYEAMTLDGFASNPAAPPPTSTASRITTIEDTRNDPPTSTIPFRGLPFANRSLSTNITTINGVPTMNGVLITSGIPFPSNRSVSMPMPTPHPRSVSTPYPHPAHARPTPTARARARAPAADPGALLTIALMTADKLVSEKAGHTVRAWGYYACRPHRLLETLERAWLVAIGHAGFDARWATGMARWARRWVLWREDREAARRMRVLEREFEIREEKEGKMREDAEREARMRVLEEEMREVEEGLRRKEEERLVEMKTQEEEDRDHSEESDDDDDEALFD
ncbi:hypothetical protein UCDDS831_g02446 [Diplodia seriata]|uniref:Uncharacterized protein n=1 Tax=Diplodia seriata TaxID=420778 RepID=A0A0G2GLS6_9PEZI|nr:hypothetical protein UCDDS831_g02446 [Diplodia seriata]